MFGASAGAADLAGSCVARPDGLRRRRAGAVAPAPSRPAASYVVEDPVTTTTTTAAGGARPEGRLGRRADVHVVGRRLRYKIAELYGVDARRVGQLQRLDRRLSTTIPGIGGRSRSRPAPSSRPVGTTTDADASGDDDSDRHRRRRRPGLDATRRRRPLHADDVVEGGDNPRVSRTSTTSPSTSWPRPTPQPRLPELPDRLACQIPANGDCDAFAPPWTIAGG